MNRNINAVGIALATFAVGSAAHAGGAPALTIDANLGGEMQQIMPEGVKGEDGYTYFRDFESDALVVEIDGGNIELGWSWLADTTADRGLGSPVSISGGLVVQNNTMATQTISFQTTLPIFAALAPSSVIGGSIAASVTSNDLNGATLSTSGSTAFYQGMIDGSVVPLNAADLLPAPSSVSVGQFLSGNLGPDSFGEPIPSQSAGAINASIGIWVTFELSPGDSMSYTSEFTAAIPAPGAGAVILAAGILGIRRRRS